MKPEELDRLIHRYFEGDLSPEEEGLLWSVVRIDPAAADRFVELSELESAMVESLKAEEAAPPEVRTTRRESRRYTRVMSAPAPRRPAWPLFFAAAAMIGFLVLLIQSASDQPQPVPVVRQPDPPKRTAAPDPVVPRAEPAPTKTDAPRRVDPPVPAPIDPTPVPVPKPVDPPAPEPRAPEKPAAPSSEKNAVVVKAPAVEATVEKVEGEVVDERGATARAGQAMVSGQGLEVRKGAASVLLTDGTRVELRAETKLARILVTPDQKRLVLSRGSASFSVVRQSSRTPVVFETPHAEVTVLGTKLQLEIGKDATRVEVHEGRVRCARLPDRASTEIVAGRFAVAGKGLALTARPIMIARSFQDGVAPTADYRGTQDAGISSLEQTANFGKIEQLQLQRLSGQQTALIRWDVSSIPPGSKVVSAEVTFWVTGKLVGDSKIYALNLPFEESEATWRFAKGALQWGSPGAQADRDRGAKPIAAIAPEKPGFHTAMILDLNVVQGWINLPAQNFGILVAGPDANIWGLEARETTVPDRRPKLTITFISGK